METGALRRGTY